MSRGTLLASVADRVSDNFVKAPLVRPTVDDESGHRLGGIQCDVPTLLAKAVEVQTPLPQPVLDTIAMEMGCNNNARVPRFEAFGD